LDSLDVQLGLRTLPLSKLCIVTSLTPQYPESLISDQPRSPRATLACSPVIMSAAWPQRVLALCAAGNTARGRFSPLRRVALPANPSHADADAVSDYLKDRAIDPILREPFNGLSRT
jgi:hypothetical protein